MRWLKVNVDSLVRSLKLIGLAFEIGCHPAHGVPHHVAKLRLAEDVLIFFQIVERFWWRCVEQFFEEPTSGFAFQLAFTRQSLRPGVRQYNEVEVGESIGVFLPGEQEAFETLLRHVVWLAQDMGVALGGPRPWLRPRHPAKSASAIRRRSLTQSRSIVLRTLLSKLEADEKRH